MSAPDGPSEKAENAPSSDADFARRLNRLSRELNNGRHGPVAAETSPHRSAANYAQAFRLSSLFVAAILVGAALGWGLDWAAGTSPWGLITLLLLGFCAGVLNVVREAGRPPASGPGNLV
jgi:ATP synthase protein I